MDNGEYLQAFLVVMETGVCALAVVEGEDANHGEGLALSDVQTVLDGQVYSSTKYPVTEDMKPGVFVFTMQKESLLEPETNQGPQI